MKAKEIIALLPYQEPFLFVTDLESVNENGVTGSHTFLKSADFYKGPKTNCLSPGSPANAATPRKRLGTI